MRSVIRNPEDFWSGIMFLAISLATIIIARDYPMGTAGRMGPGFFPSLLGWVLAVISITTLLGSVTTDGEPLERFAYKDVVLILGSVLLFGFLVRGAGHGALLGILPGGGAMLSSFASYSIEKKVSPNKAQFGQGAIEGVAAPEAANNAGAQTSFIPMLTLGIPSNPVMALMIGAMIIQGIQPGPGVITEQPALFWGIIASMWIGNFFLIVLNLPMIGLWVRMIMVPYHMLYPAILLFCAIGVFSLNNSDFDIYLMAVFGLFGYICAKLECEPAPLMLGFIIGPMMEKYLRRALLLSGSDPMVFLSSPISATMLAMSLFAMVMVMLPALRKKREEAFVE